jgi:hypothetical protein
MAGKFEPKTPVQLNPPKDDPITLEELAQADGKHDCILRPEIPARACFCDTKMVLHGFGVLAKGLCSRHGGKECLCRDQGKSMSLLECLHWMKVFPCGPIDDGGLLSSSLVILPTSNIID